MKASNETFGETCNDTAKKLAAQVVCGMPTDPIPTPDTGSDTIRSAKLEGYGENTTGGEGDSVVKASTGEALITNGGDAIGMENGVNNVWVDHNMLEASGV